MLAFVSFVRKGLVGTPSSLSVWVQPVVDLPEPPTVSIKSRERKLPYLRQKDVVGTEQGHIFLSRCETKTRNVTPQLHVWAPWWLRATG